MPEEADVKRLRWTKLLVAGFALLLISACAGTTKLVTGQPRTPIDPAGVTLYSSPPPQYEEIAVIEAHSRGSFAVGEQNKLDAVIARLKKAAGELGANGVLLQSTGSGGGGGGIGTGVGASSGGGVFISTGIFTSSTYKTARGLAIHVPPEQ
jgi:hypothetical protein